jgi:two-component system, LytTR family, sensor kinase
MPKANSLSSIPAPINPVISLPKDILDSLSLNASLIENYIFTNTTESRRLLEIQEDLLQRYQDPIFLIQYHLHSAILENQFYNFQESEIHFKLLLAMLEEYGDVNQQTEAFIDYAGTLLNLGKKDLAMEYIDKANKNLATFPDPVLLARLTFREGFLWLHYGDNAKSVELFLQADKKFLAIDATKLKVKDIYFVTLIYSGLGQIFNRTGELVLSVKYYLETLKICETNGIYSRISWHNLNLGNA